MSATKPVPTFSGEMLVRELPEGLALSVGSHPPPNGKLEACFMEAVSWRAGRDWSDHPECVSPVIAAFGRSWNDSLDDEERQVLLPYIDRVIGTAGTPGQEGQRAWMATDWLVREYTPAWLRLAGLDEHAHMLENLAALTDSSSARSTESIVFAAREAAREDARAAAGDAAWAAAGDAAWGTAWAAAWGTAWAAARAAAGDAAWGAAWAAARSRAAGDAARAAWAAAGDAAWAAAREAALVAAGDVLAPTIKALQKSALGLLNRMIEVTA